MTRGAVQPTDEDLVAAVLAGDRERFGDLVERYQGRLVNYLFRLLRNADDAHDLAQEVLIKVYQVLDRYDPQYKFSTWLFRIAQNAAIDQIRRRRLKLVSLRTCPRRSADPMEIFATGSEAMPSSRPSTDCPGSTGSSFCCVTSASSRTRRSPV